MIKSFNFFMPPAIYFGQGKFNLLPGLIAQHSDKIALVLGKNSFVSTEKFNSLKISLDEKKICYEVVTISTEPTPEDIDNAVNHLRTFAPGLVVAIGGGSVLDSGKAISAMLTKSDSIIHYLEEIGTKQHDGKKIPFIAVPTTSGTGSEATKNAVISKIGSDGYKKSLRHDNFVPDVALVDPLLTLNCPPDITAACGLDAFSQLLEAYLSINANPITEQLAFRGIKKVVMSLIAVYKNGNDIEARTNLAFASLFSGICLANAGLGTVHGFAASIGSMFDIPHGVVCGTLVAACNKFTIKRIFETEQKNEALAKYVKTGRLFSNAKNYHDLYYIDLFIDKLYEMTNALNIPKLSSFGVKKEHFDSIIAKTDNKNNPIKLSNEDFRAILKERF